MPLGGARRVSVGELTPFFTIASGRPETLGFLWLERKNSKRKSFAQIDCLGCSGFVTSISSRPPPFPRSLILGLHRNHRCYPLDAVKGHWASVCRGKKLPLSGMRVAANQQIEETRVIQVGS